MAQLMLRLLHGAVSLETASWRSYIVETAS